MILCGCGATGLCLRWPRIETAVVAVDVVLTLKFFVNADSLDEERGEERGGDVIELVAKDTEEGVLKYK